MPDKYKNKYRIPSSRLKSWDYRWDGAYFITICTSNREHYFGTINDGVMQLSNIGVIANIFWHEKKNHTKNVELGEFVVMPNHIHGVVILNNPDDVQTLHHHDVQTLHHHDVQTLHHHDVQTLHATSLRNNKNKFMAAISPKSNSISTIIRSYKSAVTKHARRLGYSFAWQPRFHDHIIRNNESYNRISEYIINNPTKWEQDKFYSLTK